MITLPAPADRPTMYFIGVTTGQSSIMRIFPVWAKALGIDGVIKGIDIAIHAPAEDYRRVVSFIKSDPLSMGALVTTHKIDLLAACRDLFEYLDPYARLFGELSSISKADGRLCGHAKDPITVGLALDAFLPADYWRKNPAAEVCVLGAGGSALAVSAYLGEEKHGDNVPRRIHMTNRSAPRLAEAVNILRDSRVPLSFHLCPRSALNDRAGAFDRGRMDLLHPRLDPGDRRGLSRGHLRRAAGPLRRPRPQVTPEEGIPWLKRCSSRPAPSEGRSPRSLTG
jgi:shikimate 5-dehydrogenase